MRFRGSLAAVGCVLQRQHVQLCIRHGLLKPFALLLEPLRPVSCSVPKPSFRLRQHSYARSPMHTPRIAYSLAIPVFHEHVSLT